MKMLLKRLHEGWEATVCTVVLGAHKNKSDISCFTTGNRIFRKPILIITRLPFWVQKLLTL